MGREGRQVKVLRSTDRPLSGKGRKVPGARPPTTTPNACLFGFPVKMARPEDKGKHHTALRASALAWQGPKGHMFALPKVSAALGSLGRSDHTPTAARRQAQPSAHSPSGDLGALCGAGIAGQGQGGTTHKPGCSSLNSL